LFSKRKRKRKQAYYTPQLYSQYRSIRFSCKAKSTV